MFERGPLFATMAQQIGIVTLTIAVAFGTLLYTLSSNDAEPSALRLANLT